MQRSKSGYQSLFTIFGVYFSLCTFWFLCFFVPHLIIFMHLICMFQILTMKEKKLLKNYFQLSVQIPFALCNFLFCEMLILGRNSASLCKCTEWNILVFLQNILCWPILPDAHLPLVLPIIILCFLPAAIGIFHKYQRISLFSLLSSSSMCKALMFSICHHCPL